MTLVAGCYERFLFGFDVDTLVKGQSDKKLPQTFTQAAHQGPVRSVALGLPFLVSGGSDDQVHIYNLESGKDDGFLVNPGEGAVNVTTFHGPATAARPSHLFTGGQDGSVCIWKAGGDWEMLKRMTGHLGAVNDIAVHNSGRVALSVARDGFLRMWNLIKGNSGYAGRLPGQASIVKFAPDGEVYFADDFNKVHLYSTEGDGTPDTTFTHERRVLAGIPVGDHVMTGCEGGDVYLWDQRASEPAMRLNRLHTTRIRGLSVLDEDQGSPPGLPLHFATASSDGVVRVWDGRAVGRAASAAGGAPEALGEATTRARITCMAAVPRAEAVARERVLTSRAEAVEKKRAEKSASVPKKKAKGKDKGEVKKAPIKAARGITAAKKAAEEINKAAGTSPAARRAVSKGDTKGVKGGVTKKKKKKST